jgi:cytochrome c oxidase cbb3-type subunit III
MSSRFLTPDRKLLLLIATTIGAASLGFQTSQAASAPPTNASQPLTVPTTALYPGGETPPPEDPHVKEYQGNAQHIAEGKKLFGWYNCSGCHFHGAGGMGPPLMNDGHWIYGGRLDQIFATIYQGRPNGMPSWGTKLPADQIWAIAAYVKALSDPAQNPKVDQPPPPAPESK